MIDNFSLLFFLSFLFFIMEMQIQSLEYTPIVAWTTSTHRSEFRLGQTPNLKSESEVLSRQIAKHPYAESQKDASLHLIPLTTPSRSTIILI